MKSRIRGGQRLRGIEARVPGDLSSAAFFLCAAALFPNSQLTVTSLLMNPTRARLLDILMQMGLRISVTQLEEVHGELVGTLQVEGGRLTGATIAGADTAALIDEIPVLAAIAPYRSRESRSAMRKSYASRSQTGSRLSPPTFGPWVLSWKNAKTG